MGYNSTAYGKANRHIQHQGSSLRPRWDTSQDSKQISSLASIIGYQAKRKVSSSGTLYFSESNLIHEVGRTISIKNFNELNLPWDKTISKTHCPK